MSLRASGAGRRSLAVLRSRACCWATCRRICGGPPASRRLLAARMLFDLSEHVEQIVYDSIGWTRTAQGRRRHRRVAYEIRARHGIGRRPVASDLNWRRSNIGDECSGQALAPASRPGAESITEVRVEHGPHAVVQAWELVSWLATRLGWRVQAGRVQVGVEIGWDVVAPHGPLRIRIVACPRDVRSSGDCGSPARSRENRRAEHRGRRWPASGGSPRGARCRLERCCSRRKGWPIWQAVNGGPRIRPNLPRKHGCGETLRMQSVLH